MQTNTNKIFSLKRFYNLLRYDFLLNFKRYLLAVAGCTIILYLLQLLVALDAYNTCNTFTYLPLFSMSLCAVGAFIASSFPEFNDKIKGSNYLLIPASIFEKFLSQFLIRIVLLSAFFMFIFWADTYLVKWTISSFSEKVKAGNLAVFGFDYSEIFPNTKLIAKLAIVIGAFSFMSFLFSARLFFGRLPALKTIIATAVIVFAFFCLMVLLSDIFYQVDGFQVDLQGYDIMEGINNAQLYVYILAFSLWAILLPIGYFKLKEKQI